MLFFWLALIGAFGLLGVMWLGDDAGGGEGGGDDDDADDGDEALGEVQEALKDAGIDPKYVGIVDRAFKKRKKAKEAEERAAAAEAKLNEAESGRVTRRKERLIEMAREQGFSDDSIDEFLSDEDAELSELLDEFDRQLKADRKATREKAKAAGKKPPAPPPKSGGDEEPKWAKELRDQVKALRDERDQARENADLVDQLDAAIRELGDDYDKDDKIEISEKVDEAVTRARLQHKKLPDIAKLVVKEAKKLKARYDRMRTKLEKEGGTRGRLSAGEEAEEKKTFDRRVSNAEQESPGITEMVKALQK